MVDRNPRNWTLTDAARLLEEPQHRLIYLCEKRVVEPDVQDAEGRGSSRRFSARNLLEFAVALRLRELEIPVGIVGAVIHVLREFGRIVASEISEFSLPEGLREPKAPDLRILIGDGQRLYFSLQAGKAAPKLFGGMDLRQLVGPAARRRGAARGMRLVDAASRSPSDFGMPEGSRHTRVEVSVTGIARDLKLDN